MALTRTQIELLITARNQAQQAFDGLNRQVKQLTGEAQGASEQMGNLDTKTKAAGAGATAAGVAFGMLAERVARGLVGAFKDTITAANQLDAGLIGLSSVANAFGQGADKAKQAAQELAKDGLMGVGDAATGLKNLLAAGFNLDQAIVLMNRFKDSAAFGRQGSLAFGEAIRSATEGIKNGNSILVDNAGVTKNLSVMLTEAGLSAQDLGKASSDVNVRMAIYNGIIRETKAQTGDAAKLLETAAGQQAKFNAQVEIAQQKIGKALQPALAAVLQTLTPLAQFVGRNAETFVHLGAAVSAVIIPMAALKLAAMSGLTPALAGAAAGISTFIGAASGGVKTLGDFRAAIQLAGEGAGLTAANLGVMGTAASVAAAAFVGWQIGKVIDDFTGLSGAVERATVKLMGWSDAAQVAGAKQDVIQRAVKAGAASTITYAQAIEYNNRVDAIRIAQFDKSAAAQLKRIEAEQALGRITLEQANAQKAGIEAETQAATVRASRLKMTDALAASEKKFQEEVKATGYSQAELAKALAKDEEGFKAWAKQVQLSDSTMARLKDQVQASTAAQKKAADEAKKHKEALAELAAVNLELGQQERIRIEILDKEGVSEKAIAEITGIHEAAVRKYLDALKDQKKAEEELGEFKLERLKAFVESNQKASEAIMDREKATMDASTKQLADLVLKHGEYQGKITEQGLSGTKLELFRLDQEYQAEVQALGKRTAMNAAYWDKAKADIDRFYSGQRTKITGFWQTIVPEALGTLNTLQAAVTGSFAQMALGAKSFSEGWKDIWGSMKQAALNVLNELLNAFLNRFLKGILGAMQGQKGALSGAFAGMFGGGGGSTSGLASVAGGLFGAGGGGFSIPGGMDTSGLNTPPPGVSAAGGGMNWGGAGLGAAAGGITGGLVGYQTGSKSKGALSGAASGAMAGMVAGPVGAAIGAGVGALAGLIGGWLGGKKEYNQVKTDRAGFEAQFGGTQGTIEAVSKAYATLGKSGTEAEAALKNLWNAKKAEDYQKAVQTITDNLAAAKLKQEELNAAADDGSKNWQALQSAAEKYGISLDALGPKFAQAKADDVFKQIFTDYQALIKAGADVNGVLSGMSDEISSLVQDSVKFGTEIPANMKPLIEQLLASGQLVDENGEKLTDLSQLKFAEPIAEGFNKVVKAIDRLAGVLSGDLPAAARAGADGVNRELDRVDGRRITVGVDYEGGGGPRGGFWEGPSEPPQPEGGAAGGVMANRPGLVLFGEGGETEVGGPASFFEKVFEKLGVGTKAGGGGVGGSLTIGPFYISGLTSGNDLRDAAEKQLLPMILDALRVNRRGSLTDLQTILGD